MWNNVPKWLKITWAVIVGLGVVAGLAAAMVQIIEYCEDRQPTPTPPPTVVQTPMPTSTLIPTITPTPTMGPFQFLTLPTQVKIGEGAKVVLQVWEGATCFLEYYTSAVESRPSSADGLGLVNSDSQGRCTWEWHISANTLPGDGRLVFTVNDVQEIHPIQILAGD